MARFRSRPREITAGQFELEMTVAEAEQIGVCTRLCGRNAPRTLAHVHTIHNAQMVEIEDGDWIVPEPDSIHYYPIKPDIFEATYEPAD